MSFHLGIHSDTNICITLAGEQLEQVHKYKYLGFVLDDRLRFDYLLTDLYSKLNHLYFILAKIHPYLTTKALGPGLCFIETS